MPPALTALAEKMPFSTSRKRVRLPGPSPVAVEGRVAVGDDDGDVEGRRGLGDLVDTRGPSWCHRRCRRAGQPVDPVLDGGRAGGGRHRGERQRGVVGAGGRRRRREGEGADRGRRAGQRVDEGVAAAFRFARSDADASWTGPGRAPTLMPHLAGNVGLLREFCQIPPDASLLVFPVEIMKSTVEL